MRNRLPSSLSICVCVCVCGELRKAALWALLYLGHVSYWLACQFLTCTIMSSERFFFLSVFFCPSSLATNTKWIKALLTTTKRMAYSASLVQRLSGPAHSRSIDVINRYPRHPPRIEHTLFLTLSQRRQIKYAQKHTSGVGVVVVVVVVVIVRQMTESTTWRAGHARAHRHCTLPHVERARVCFLDGGRFNTDTPSVKLFEACLLEPPASQLATAALSCLSPCACVPCWLYNIHSPSR